MVNLDTQKAELAVLNLETFIKVLQESFKVTEVSKTDLKKFITSFEEVLGTSEISKADSEKFLNIIQEKIKSSNTQNINLEGIIKILQEALPKIELEKHINLLKAELQNCDAVIQKLSLEKLTQFKFLRVYRNFLKDKPTAKPTDITTKLNASIKMVETELLANQGKDKAEAITMAVKTVCESLCQSIISQKALPDFDSLADELSTPIEQAAHTAFPIAAFFAEHLKTKPNLGNTLGAEEFYNLYSWFKQAVFEDIVTKKPSLTDVTLNDPFLTFKWDRWNAKRGELRGLMQRHYIELVINILSKHRNHKAVIAFCSRTSDYKLNARIARLRLFFDIIKDCLANNKDKPNVVAFCKFSLRGCDLDPTKKKDTTLVAKDDTSFFAKAKLFPEVEASIAKFVGERDNNKKVSQKANNNNNATKEGNNNSSLSSDVKDAVEKSGVKDNNNDGTQKPKPNLDNNNDGLNNNNNRNFLPGFQAQAAQSKSTVEPIITFQIPTGSITKPGNEDPKKGAQGMGPSVAGGRS